MRARPTIAIAGATGLVGSEMISVLSELKIPFDDIRLLASEDSKGEIYKVGDHECEVEVLDESSFDGVDIALFATGADLSEKFVPIAVKAGAVAIDNSSFFRLHNEVPLVVPEVNADAITASTKIIANPNCSTIQLVPVLDVINTAAPIKRVVVSTYQSVSGAGKAALDELWGQSISIFNQNDLEIEEFPHQIAFNCIPQIDLFREDGYTKEEHKIINESRKILNLPNLRITATTVRVPVFYSHAESVNIELERDLSPEKLLTLLEKSAGIEAFSDHGDYPMQITAAGGDMIQVGRIRRDFSVEFGLNLWIVADNVRKGAALNAVQIAKLLLDRFGS